MAGYLWGLRSAGGGVGGGGLINARHHLAADRPKKDRNATVAAQVHGDVSRLLLVTVVRDRRLSSYRPARLERLS